MAYITDIRRTEGAIATAVRAMIERIKINRAYRAAFKNTLAELEALSRRELDDVGIAPSQFAEIARKSGEEAVAALR